jgi:hypothetical protein
MADVQPHTPTAILQHVRLAKDIAEKIRAAGISPDDPDFETLLDSETDALDLVRGIVRAVRKREADARALAEMIAELQARKTRFERGAQLLRETVTWALSELGRKRLDSPDFTATVQHGKPPLVGLETLDAKTLPDRLCVIEKRVSRTHVRAELESGGTIDGVTLGNPEPFLVVRRS